MKSESISVTGRLVLAFAIALGMVVVAIPPAQAQTFSVVHNFTGGSDGGGPLSGFITDSTGNMYGTTNSGGASNFGVVFKVNTSGVETVLHTFNGGTDGANPDGRLVRDKAGNLYGTTTAGGVNGAGTVFEVSPAGKEIVLHSLIGGTQGSDPEAGLAMDAAGNLYGTATAGGANGNGTVFELVKPKTGGKWLAKTLYSFGNGADGRIPVAGVAFDGAGNLYGTTSLGGTYGYGTVFELTLSGSSWTETILHHFQDGDDGGTPYAGLIFEKGNFYGAATEAGSGGGGVVFELTPATGGGWTFTELYSQPGWGISGTFRNLIMDATGNLYGTTHCDGAPDAGTVYKLTLESGSWVYTSLYIFTGGTDGLYSFSNLVLEHGKLYGTTNEGGADNYGVIFEVTP
jgi:uncharacterized repeat protein (TIGR03803 family)